jgi:hypothetical protein
VPGSKSASGGTKAGARRQSGNKRKVEMYNARVSYFYTIYIMLLSGPRMMLYHNTGQRLDYIWVATAPQNARPMLRISILPPH